MKEQEAITREEAIKRLKESRFTIQPYNYMNQALDMAISALEKQIPKKPTPIDYKKYMDVVNNAISLRGGFWCPNCKKVVRSGSYCNDCGQKLDWSEI